MVFTIDAKVLRENFKDRIVPIIKQYPSLTTARAVNVGGSVPLQQGILAEVGFQFSATNLRKGECYVYCYVQKITASNAIQIVLVDDYIYNAADPHWVGELPVEDGDAIVSKIYLSNTTVKFIQMTGYMVRV